SSASLFSNFSDSFIEFSSRADGLLLAVEGHQRGFVVDGRQQVRRPAPDYLKIAKGVGGMIQTEVDAVVLVQQKQLPPVPVVPIVYVNPRLAIVRQTEQQPLLDLLEVAGLDVVLSRLFL